MFNLPVFAAAALIPLVVGFIWYNPKFGFGNAWMKSANLTDEKLKGGNMAIIFGLTYLFSFFIAVILSGLVIHQASFFSLMQGQPEGPETKQIIDDFLAIYGDRFRTFKHGALHGTITALFFVLPVVGINALFERRGFKYIAIHVGYWVVCLALMGGVICQFV